VFTPQKIAHYEREGTEKYIFLSGVETETARKYSLQFCERFALQVAAPVTEVSKIRGLPDISTTLATVVAT